MKDNKEGKYNFGTVAKTASGHYEDGRAAKLGSRGGPG